jgi:hypothetical protein
MRQDKVGALLHYSICKALGTEKTDKWYTHTQKPVCEHEDVTVLSNQGVHTDREVTVNRPDILIKNKKEKTCMLIDVAIPANRNVTQKEVEQKLKYKSHWNSNKMFKEKFRSHTRKTFNRFTTKDSYTWNITHNTESIAL